MIVSEPRARVVSVLRAVIFTDAVVFLTAAMLNMGISIPLGFADLSFPVPIWQAGIGEAIIGLALLTAAVTGSIGLSWVAYWMSAAGIIFGLSSPRVEGLAHDAHILMIPLAAVVFGLLLWVGRQNGQPRPETDAPRRGATAQPQPVSIAVSWLIVVATVAFAVASIVHFGVVIRLGPVALDDPFSGAAIPEAVIATVLAIGSVAAIGGWREGRWVAVGTTLFALLATIYGLSITISSARTGDVAYHVTILAVLAVIMSLLLRPNGRQSLSDR